MSLPATLFFVYLVAGVLFALVVVIAKKKEGGFWSSYPWAAEPALFGIAIVFWPITLLMLMSSGLKKRKTKPNQSPEPTH